MPIRSADGAGGSRHSGKQSFALEMREAACGAGGGGGGRGAEDVGVGGMARGGWKSRSRR